MDKNKLQKECMGIVNQLFDLAEVPVEKRQSINDTADKYLQEQFLRLFAVSGSFSQKDMENFAAKCILLGHGGKTTKELMDKYPMKYLIII